MREARCGMHGGFIVRFPAKYSFTRGDRVIELWRAGAMS